MKRFGIGKWGGAGFVYTVLILGILAVINCTQEIEPPQWGGGDGEKVHCILPGGTTCVFIDLAACQKNGGTSVESCPDTGQSSNSGGGNDSSNSGGDNDSSNSGGGTSSSSGTTQSSGGTATSSSSTTPSGSSSSGTSLCGANSYNPATQFCDTRDYTVYKYERAPALDGLVWMSENLNYSKGGTIGYCYKAGSVVLGTPGEEGVGCDSPYGRNYTWAEAMDNACPNGWHLPSQAEWKTISTRNIMSSDFYVKAGNYYQKWQERGTGITSTSINGFYWARDAYTYFARMYNLSGAGNYLEADRINAAAADVFSVRCVEGVLTGGGSSSSGVSGSSSSGSAWTAPIAYPLTEGTKSDGSFIGVAGSHAWYSFSVTASTSYRFWFYDSDLNSSYTLNAKYTIYHGNGTVIYDGEGLDFGYLPAISETVYIKVYPSSESASTGNYAVAYTTTTPPTRP